MKAPRFLLPLLCLFFFADVAPSGCGPRTPRPAPRTTAAEVHAAAMPS